MLAALGDVCDNSSERARPSGPGLRPSSSIGAEPVRVASGSRVGESRSRSDAERSAAPLTRQRRDDGQSRAEDDGFVTPPALRSPMS